MTCLLPSFFQERQKVLEEWTAKGFLELSSLVIPAPYTWDDVVKAGVVEEDMLPAGTDAMAKYRPKEAWADRIHKGGYLTWFVSSQDAAAIIAIVRKMGGGN